MTYSTAPDYIKRRYLCGKCGAFAIALHRKIGLPLWGLHDPISGDLYHAMVVRPDEWVGIDIRGALPLDAMWEGFGPGLVALPITEDDIHAKLRSYSDEDLRIAKRDVGEYLRDLPRKRRPEAPEVAHLRQELLRRGQIVAGMLGWRPEKLDAYCREVAAAKIVQGKPYLERGAEECGLSEEDSYGPGMESRMSPDAARAHGTWIASRTIAAWLSDPRIAQEPVADCARDEAEKLARLYLDSDQIEAADWESLRFKRDVNLSDLIDGAYEGNPAGFIQAEHEAALGDGRNGYEDLLLERIRAPVVLVRYADGAICIMDGWHRIAAALAMEAFNLDAVMVDLPEPAVEYGHENFVG